MTTGEIAFDVAARLFFLKWTYISSKIIRDLTLKSAPSFGAAPARDDPILNK